MKFAKIFLAALLGCIVSGIVGFLIWLGVIFAMVGSFGTTPVELLPGSILKIELDGTFTDSPSSDPFSQIDFMTMEMTSALSLLEALTALEAAATDDNIEAIYLNISPAATLSTAQIEELRAALNLFKESGKPVISYNTQYTQGGYYLSTVSDKIYAQPEGSMMWQGMASSPMFYKGLLDKLDVTVEIFRPTVCRYKSAVEPFFLDKMSPENRAQMGQLLGSIWSTVASDVALDRGLTLEEVNRIATTLECMDVDGALSAKMIDGLVYEDELPRLFREAGAKISDKDQDVNYIDFADYVSLKGTALKNFSAPKIGVIYAEGNIVDGEGTDAKVYGDTTAEIVRQARFDDSIEAVVLRVNSPGGSALASDIMWRELELLRQEKPLIVSMGSYAASGGYYISAPADVILTDRTTLTGSIGVFGMIPNVEKGLKNKIGITFDTVATNPSANFMRSLNGMSTFEKKKMVESVDKVYGRFTSIVSEGRNLPLDNVLEIAQGRVWSGTDAVELGLADATGGLREAISVAATKAGIDDNFRVVELLGEPTGFAALFSGVETSVASLLKAFANPVNINQFDKYQAQVESALEQINTTHGLVMYSPYSVEF